MKPSAPINVSGKILHQIEAGFNWGIKEKAFFYASKKTDHFSFVFPHEINSLMEKLQQKSLITQNEINQILKPSKS